MKIVNAKWKVANPMAGDTYTIKGTGPMISGGTIDIPPTPAMLVGGTTDIIEINNVDATRAFEAMKVRFFNTFDIEWEVSVNGGAYQSAEKSDNPIYVCLKGPNPTGSPAPLTAGMPIPHRTVVHVACGTEGATNADTAVTNSWGHLSGPSNLNAWDDATNSFSRPLHYYKPGTTFGNNPDGAVSGLLQNETGQCSTWAELMYDALRLNDAEPDYVHAMDDRAVIDGFLVKDWTPNAFAGVKVFRFGGAAADMMPKPKDALGNDTEIYGDFTSANTLKGQNSGMKAPSQKYFNNHQFLKYTPTAGPVVYYDASYGVTYDGELDFQTDAIDGFAAEVGVIGGFYEMDVIQTPAADWIQFILNPGYAPKY